jgi:hypothetical protein
MADVGAYGLPYLKRDNVLRRMLPLWLYRLVMWTILCSVSAAPSFLFASAEFHDGAMLLGVGLFIVALTATTCTERFERFRRKRYIRRTLYIGYGARLAISVLFPIAFILDMWPGMLSVAIAGAIVGDPETFAGTLIATLVQGTLLNCIVGIFMLIVYGLCHAFGKKLPPGGACESCGYDLRGTTSGVCSECGAPVRVAAAVGTTPPTEPAG